MRTSTRGFLLFSFAFSSVLSSPEVLQSPLVLYNEKPDLAPTANYPSLESQKGEANSFRIQAQKMDRGLEKRLARIFSENYNLVPDKEKELYESLQALDNDRDKFEKRSRMGFNGMRGKKEFSTDDYCAKLLRPYPESSLILNKRLSNNLGELFGSKRAPVAFHGMRGKKVEDYENEIIDPFDNRNFLIDSGLIDDPEGEIYNSGGQLEEKYLEDGVSKRSPYSFLGMRGKKEIPYDLKRAKGFLGMRGKKTTDVWNPNYKRAPQTSFFGMKGKKAQSSGFFGMRGKKASPSSFFGIKGKQEPLDYDFQDFSSPLSQMKNSESNRARYRRGVAWFTNSKKAKNSFFGIRGKKSTEEKPGIVLFSYE